MFLWWSWSEFLRCLPRKALKTIPEERRWWSPYRWGHCEKDTVPMPGACSASCLYFKSNAQTSFSKFTINIFPSSTWRLPHLPNLLEEKGLTKPHSNQSSSQETLADTTLLMLLPQLSPGLEFLLAKHTPGLPGGAAVGSQLSGDTKKQSTNTGLGWDWGGVVLLLHQIPGIVQQGIPACIWSGSNSPSALPGTKEHCPQGPRSTVTSSPLSCQLHIQQRWDEDLLWCKGHHSFFQFGKKKPNTKPTCQVTRHLFKKRNIQYWTKENSVKNLVGMLFQIKIVSQWRIRCQIFQSLLLTTKQKTDSTW